MRSPKNLPAWSASCVADHDGTYLWFTTSTYHAFQTAQIEELFTQYGLLFALWIDTPGVLDHGYREYLYRRIASTHPQTVIVMDSGSQTGEDLNIDFTWPTDVITIEMGMPSAEGHRPWRTIEGHEYHLPAEKCSPLGQRWFWVPDDPPRPEAELAAQFEACRARRVNFLLNPPPDRHGRLSQDNVYPLMRLRRNAKI